jgi:hypothetical protein
VSVTFDEYSSLSIPIPIRNTKTATLNVQLLDRESMPVKIDVEVEISATMIQLKNAMIDKLIQYKVLKPIFSKRSSFLNDENVLKKVKSNTVFSEKTTSQDGFEVVHHSEVQVNNISDAMNVEDDVDESFMLNVKSSGSEEGFNFVDNNSLIRRNAFKFGDNVKMFVNTF